MKSPIPLIAAAVLVAPLQAAAQGAAGSISIKFASPPTPGSFPSGSVPVPPPQFVSPAALGPGAVGAFIVPGAPRAGISWQPFNIQKADTPRFSQPAASAVANRVAAESAPQVSGALQVHLRAAAGPTFPDVHIELTPPAGVISATQATLTPEGRIAFRAAKP